MRKIVFILFVLLYALHGNSQSIKKVHGESAQDKYNAIDSADVAFATIVNDDNLTESESKSLKCTIDSLLSSCNALGESNSQFVIVASFSRMTSSAEKNPETKEPSMVLKATLELRAKDRRNDVQLLVRHFDLDIKIKGGETLNPYSVVIECISPKDKRLQNYIHWSQKFAEALCPKLFNP